MQQIPKSPRWDMCRKISNKSWIISFFHSLPFVLSYNVSVVPLIQQGAAGACRWTQGSPASAPHRGQTLLIFLCVCMLFNVKLFFIAAWHLQCYMPKRTLTQPVLHIQGIEVIYAKILGAPGQYSTSKVAKLYEHVPLIFLWFNFYITWWEGCRYP